MASTPRPHVTALYLHVPFCPSVCPYCDFHKMLRSEPLVARYLDRLEVEAAALAMRYRGPLETVYFGGGTPSHLRDHELERVFALLRTHWVDEHGRLGARETTLEADPRTFDAQRLEFFRSLGVTRLSIGLQSSQDEVLKFLGRVHSAEEGLAAVSTALASGLGANVDIMTSIPGQDLERDLRTVLDLGVKHLSVYSLTIEPNTPFGWRGVTVDAEADADAFELAGTIIKEYGLERYEVSNFAAPGHESVHNLTYWRGGHYLALGPGASAYLPEGRFGVRLKSAPIKGWLLGVPPERDGLGATDVVLERLMTGLRTREGVDLRELHDITGLDVTEHAAVWLQDGLRHGLLTLTSGGGLAPHAEVGPTDWATTIQPPPEPASSELQPAPQTGIAAADGPLVLRATPVGLERLDGLLRAFVNVWPEEPA